MRRSRPGSAPARLRALEISSYQTAWTMLHRLRSVRVRPGRDRLNGTVEVDETYIGGEEPGRGFGRVRMQRIPDATAETLRGFLSESVEPGSTVVTDGLISYVRAASAVGCDHRPIVGAKEELPGVLKGATSAIRV